MSGSEEDLLEACYFPSSIEITEEIPKGVRFEIKKIQDRQKLMICQKSACDVNLSVPYEIFNYVEDDYIDRLCILLIRAFNCDCHIIMSKIKQINIHVLGEMIEKSFYELNGLGEFKRNLFSVSISFEYFNLKLDELVSYYNYLNPDHKIDHLIDL
jgi:hypothetical protein